MTPDSSPIYEEQMAEITKVDAVIQGLRDELNCCPATVRGYRQAADLRSNIAMRKDMRLRLVAALNTAGGSNDR